MEKSQRKILFSLYFIFYAVKKNIEKRQKTRKKNGKEYEQAVHSKETQVTNKYMKSSSAMQVIREM